METIQCSGCKNFFPKQELFVFMDASVWCNSCRPVPSNPITISLHLGWEEALALESYLANEADVDALFKVDELRYYLRDRIYKVVKDINDKIQESNQESLD